MKSQLIEYHDGDTLLEGYCAFPEKISDNLPVVLVVHDWSGKNPFACSKADKLAQLGYIGFAIDMYGNGKMGITKEQKAALMSPLMEDRLLLKNRILAAFKTAKTIPSADINKIGAIGFCFGGLCALDLARSGEDVKGVVSFHGILTAPDDYQPSRISAKVLALHGYNDPMVTSDRVILFADEMTEAGANWQLDMYGNTVHAFTNPEANDKDFGTVYDKQADHRSWIAMVNFFREVFA